MQYMARGGSPTGGKLNLQALLVLAPGDLLDPDRHLFHAAFDERQNTRPFFCSILTGSALLYILNRNRSQYSTDALRVLADVALIAPLLVFVALSRG